MPETIFMGLTISDKDVREALDSFDAEHPDSNSYEEWQEKANYRYALRYGGKLYPPKHILSRVSGISTAEFNGGEQTNRVFRQLGFEIIDKP